MKDDGKRAALSCAGVPQRFHHEALAGHAEKGVAEMTAHEVAPQAARPIIFSGPSILAIMAGKKTQTRRVIKLQPPVKWNRCEPIIGVNGAGVIGWEFFSSSDLLDHGYLKGRPTLQVGQTLWVKETWQYALDAVGIWYRVGTDEPDQMKWRSPLFMPRKYSRITLRITDVRVERLLDITEADALAEGMTDEYPLDCPSCRGFGKVLRWTNSAEYGPSETDEDCLLCGQPRRNFMLLWDKLNAKRKYITHDKNGDKVERLRYPAESNPWVFALTFTRETP